MTETPQAPPSSVRTVADVAQVMVDQWGHRGEFLKNQIISRADLDPAAYDWDHAVRMGTLRLLSEAEARVWAVGTSPNTALGDDGREDLMLQTAVRTGAGMPFEPAQTITTGQGPAEPAELSKSGNNEPPARPIVEGGATSSGEPANAPARPSAADLVAQARAANTPAELDAIDAQADNRMTSVHEAVAQRRSELVSAPSTPPQTPKDHDEG